MARAYNIDLRERIANAQGSYSEIAERFCVSKYCVWKYKKQQQEEGHLETQYSKTVRKRVLNEEQMMILKEYVESNSDATQLEMCQFMQETCCVKIAKSTMHNYLKKLNLTLKKSNSATRKYILKK
jgi:transposase